MTQAITAVLFGAGLRGADSYAPYALAHGGLKMRPCAPIQRAFRGLIPLANIVAVFLACRGIWIRTTRTSGQNKVSEQLSSSLSSP